MALQYWAALHWSTPQTSVSLTNTFSPVYCWMRLGTKWVHLGDILLFHSCISLPFSVRVPSWHRALGTQHSLCMPRKSAWKGSVINTDVRRGSFNLWSPWWLLGEKQLLWGMPPPTPNPKEAGKLRAQTLFTKWKETFGDGERVKGEGRERNKEKER